MTRSSGLISRRRLLASAAVAAGGVATGGLLSACNAGSSGGSGGEGNLTVMIGVQDLPKEQRYARVVLDDEDLRRIQQHGRR